VEGRRLKSGAVASVPAGLFLLLLGLYLLDRANGLAHAGKKDPLAGIVAWVPLMAGIIGLGNGLVQLRTSWRESIRPAAAPTTADIDNAKDVLASQPRWPHREHGERLLCAEGMPPDTSRALVCRGGVLPILDGLDELPGDARADILSALNRSMSGGRPTDPHLSHDPVRGVGRGGR
jgi:hypothetical protein